MVRRRRCSVQSWPALGRRRPRISLTQGTLRSGPLQRSPNTPPGRSTRATSLPATAGSIQCQEDDASTASRVPSRTGMRSPTPPRTAAPPLRRANTPRMRDSGSSATTRGASATRARVRPPVPAPRSSTVERPSPSTQRAASTGGPGRNWSYSSAIAPNEKARVARSGIDNGYPCSDGASSRRRRRQNSLPSGSASTTQVVSPCPMSTGRAPRARRR